MHKNLNFTTVPVTKRTETSQETHNFIASTIKFKERKNSVKDKNLQDQ